MTVKLSDIIEAIESVNESSQYFLDQETGEIVWVSEMVMSPSEQEEIYDALDEHGFYRLPTQRDIHEYGIMEEFVDSLSNPAHDRLSTAISGRGAFRRFKDEAHHLGLEQNWYSWRDKAYRNIAVAWCEENDINYTEE